MSGALHIEAWRGQARRAAQTAQDGKLLKLSIFTLKAMGTRRSGNAHIKLCTAMSSPEPDWNKSTMMTAAPLMFILFCCVIYRCMHRL